MMKGEGEYNRLFVAVAVPQEVPVLMEYLISQNPADPSLKWMRPFNLHLTVYFIGNVLHHHRAEIAEKVRKVSSRHYAFTLHPNEVCFRPVEKPRMIWLRYDTTPNFSSINSDLHSVLAEFADRPTITYEHPIPHITLARFKGFESWNALNLDHAISMHSMHITEIQIWECVEKNGRKDYVQWPVVFPLIIDEQ